MMDPVLILIQVQARSLATRVDLRWSLRLGLLLHRRALPTCLHGRICLWFKRLRLIRSRTLKKPGTASKEPRTASPSKGNRVKKKATPSNSEKTEKQVPKKREH